MRSKTCVWMILIFLISTTSALDVKEFDEMDNTLSFLPEECKEISVFAEEGEQVYITPDETVIRGYDIHPEMFQSSGEDRVSICSNGEEFGVGAMRVETKNETKTYYLKTTRTTDIMTIMVVGCLAVLLLFIGFGRR